MGKEAEGKSTRLQLAAGIRLLACALFLVWLVMWVLSPIDRYWDKWLPKLRSGTSTYFGYQGTMILVFTFPILFISVLGCIYLHLLNGRRHGEIRASPGPLGVFWKRSALVRWPLGIVSWSELAFAVMFLAFLVWYFSKFLTASFSRITAESAAKDGEEVWQAKLDSAALYLGLLGNICCAFLFFPVTRGSSLLPLAGLTSDSSIKYHIWLGHAAMVFFTAHGLCYIVFWATKNTLSLMLEWSKTGVSNVAGELALLCGLALWATTLPRVRQKLFEVFFYTHQLYAPFLLFYLLHLGISFFFLILPGIYLFLLDRFLRFLQSRRRVRLVSARLLPGNTVELNFSKSPGLQYNPLSIVFINVPGISKLQWHPFTVTSSSSLEPDSLSVLVKEEGSWSQRLSQVLSSSPATMDRLDVSLEGPYGPVSNHFLSYDSLVLVSGGSGIAPFISIIRELIFRSAAGSSPTPAIHLICAFKTSADLAMLDLLLPLSTDAAAISHLHLRVDAFVTREKAPPAAAAAKNHLRTVRFKPLPSDLPVSAVLGPHSWLWLGAVISASFVSFLILLGLLNRYYIYPIDRNTGLVYPVAPKALLSLLFICVCITTTATAAFLWNKEGAAAGAWQVGSTDAPTPMASPGSCFYNADRELESVPQESLVQSTSVQFGSRPDLQKMLLELDGSNIGVLASGPKEMRHDVAKICSSGLSKNLHFDSMSFNW